MPSRKLTRKKKFSLKNLNKHSSELFPGYDPVHRVNANVTLFLRRVTNLWIMENPHVLDGDRGRRNVLHDALVLWERGKKGPHPEKLLAEVLGDLLPWWPDTPMQPVFLEVNCGKSDVISL